MAAANATPFGLTAYFYANDVRRIWRVAKALETGLVGVNEGALPSEAAPFGGAKESATAARTRCKVSTITCT